MNLILLLLLLRKWFVLFFLKEEQITKQREEFKQNLLSDVKAHELEKENEKFKTEIINLQSEIYGARLAAKYLDKELAGRLKTKKK